MSTLFPAGTASYIYTPGLDPGPGGSSVSGDMQGAFWALGFGNPAFGTGIDSGNLAAADQDSEAWIQRPHGEPAWFDTTWANHPEIDGCIASTGSPVTCTAVLLSDQAGDRGYYAILTARPVQGDFSFVQSDNSPIVLAPIRPPVISNVTSFPDSVRGSVRVDTGSGGAHLDPGCPGDVVAGYRIYTQVRPAIEAPDPDLRRERGSWRLAVGGEGTGGRGIALGSSTQVIVPCTSDAVVRFAASLVFDSGFETAHVSEATAPIPCR